MKKLFFILIAVLLHDAAYSQSFPNPTNTDFTGNNTFNGSSSFYGATYLKTGAVAGSVMTCLDATGRMTWAPPIWGTSGNNVFLFDSVKNVGIGMSRPQYKLDVNGSVRGDSIFGIIIPSGNVTVPGNIIINGSLSVGTALNPLAANIAGSFINLYNNKGSVTGFGDLSGLGLTDSSSHFGNENASGYIMSQANNGFIDWQVTSFGGKLTINVDGPGGIQGCLGTIDSDEFSIQDIHEATWFSVNTTIPEVDIIGQLKYMYGTPGAGFVLASDAIGRATWQSGISVTSLQGTSATPTPVAGTGAGTTPTISILGTNIGGVVSVTPGLTAAASATLLTATFSGGLTYPNGCSIIITPANAATALLSGTGLVYASGNTNSFTMHTGSAALTPSTLYEWNYTVIGY